MNHFSFGPGGSGGVGSSTLLFADVATSLQTTNEMLRRAVTTRVCKSQSVGGLDSKNVSNGSLKAILTVRGASISGG